ncbi:MAG: bifunctional diaminohydroxyphosphoribosylaminopyrimidine deaminase/5-amino-6-(5-phosphoribosylamino)uracil reductase RibD [Deltaproteobacteria bacterium]|nr:bifunctional diaminohydroxyphosphoribosylaminopyrimidine deaminase/5-amino-6-(5-phosphoribosylamino)uracil reductase RibD [Deltaproteobacteria bacterium]
MSAARDRELMQRALTLAARARGRTSPNPMVGAVISDRRGRVLAEGLHRRAGTDHGEAAALRKLGWRAPGATLYVTLEPHDHHGRTPPCTERIIAAGVRRVVVAMLDPNPAVNGRGVRRLRRAGVIVEVGLLGEAAAELNRAWVHFITTGRPWVILKAALTLDGFLATRTGDSRWITGPAARASVHVLRDEVDAILVGAGTVRADDPALTTRLAGTGDGTGQGQGKGKGRGVGGGGGGRKAGRDALRVVLDGRLSIPARARLLREGDSRVLVLTSAAGAATGRRRAALAAAGADIEVLGRGAHISIDAVLRALAARGVVSLLVEGGGAVHAAFLAARAISELRLYHAPKLLGGGDGVPLFRGPGPRRMAGALALTVRQRVNFEGGDMMTIATPEWS